MSNSKGYFYILLRHLHNIKKGFICKHLLIKCLLTKSILGGKLNMDKEFSPYDREILRILEETKIVSNPNYIRVMDKIPEHFNSGIYTSMMISFNYGVMIGKRQERDLRKWNAKACFYNMHSYAKAHDGNLPKTQQELMAWVNRGACHE